MFGLHYEADNSRLYVVCAKHVTESQLVNEFSVFGAAQVKLNIDFNGLSKVSILVTFALPMLNGFSRVICPLLQRPRQRIFPKISEKFRSFSSRD